MPKVVRGKAARTVCPELASHTDGPEGYADHIEWTEKMLRTHKCRRCTGCGLWVVWVPNAKGEDG